VDAAAVTAIVAVGVSGVVGVTAVVVPAAVRRGDRQHERQMKIHDERADAYTRCLEVMSEMAGVVTRDVAATEDLKERARRAEVLVWLWGSVDARKLYMAWLGVGTDLSAQKVATEPDRQRLLRADFAVRQRMSDELQGRV
jgi:hypothetical protein